MNGVFGRDARQSDRRRATLLAAVLSVQALSAVFFIADVAGDLRWGGLTPHSVFEALVAVALIVGTGFGALEMRRTLDRIERAEAALSVASGAFSELIEDRFAAWGLTAAEADVALFTIKGMDPAQIAGLRGAAEGTVRAQLARIYAKSGVSSRGQLISLFIEDLLGEPLSAEAAAAR